MSHKKRCKSPDSGSGLALIFELQDELWIRPRNSAQSLGCTGTHFDLGADEFSALMFPDRICPFLLSEKENTPTMSKNLFKRKITDVHLQFMVRRTYLELYIYLQRVSGCYFFTMIFFSFFEFFSMKFSFWRNSL